MQHKGGTKRKQKFDTQECPKYTNNEDYYLHKINT